MRVAFKDNEPLFCAMDICNALELANGRDSVLKIFPKGIDKIYTLTNGGNQLLSYFSEMQLYKFIMRSNAKKAEAFQDWVCGEVLPTIRKRGQYSLFQEPVAPTHQIPKSYAEALLEAGRLALENERLLEQAKEDAPKVECYDALMLADGLITIGNFGKLVGVKHIFKRLREMGILMESNLPYAEYLRRGYFEVRESTYSVGDRTKIHLKSMVTTKGQAYLEKRLRGLGDDNAPLLEYF